MLEIKPQGKIIEKIVRTRTGEFVLAVFFVVESDGGLNVRLLFVKPIQKQARITNQESKIKNKILCLRGDCAKSPTVISYHKRFTPIVSPFFNKFQFLVSQPTRAPSGSF